MWTATLLPLLLVLALNARAESSPTPRSSGAPDAGLLPRELDVKRVDGGDVVEGELPAAPDAGVLPPPQLLPPRLLADSPAPYPEGLRAQRAAGQVKLELLVDETGAVASVAVLDGALPEFNEAAVAAAKGLRFEPATLGGAPVQVRLPFTYNFEAPPAPAREPTAVLKGQVRSKGNRRPITGAALRFKSLEQPIESDITGHFEVELPSGRRLVEVSAPGFQPLTVLEQLETGQTLEVIYGLEPLIVNPYETIVRDERERTEVSRITLHDQELREVPGTQGDPFRVVMLLPGVSGIASGVSYPVVRGSQPAATGTFIDGIQVPILFHLFLGPAVVHPDFIDTIDFYPGAPPPQYGRLLGGVIDGRISRPREDRIHATLYADLINAGVFLEAPIPQTGTSFTVAGRISYTPWLVALLGSSIIGDNNTRAVLDFYDYQARIEQKVGTGSLRLFAFGSSDVFGAQAQNVKGVTQLQTILFHRADLRYKQPLLDGEVEGGVTAGLDRLRLEAGASGITGITFNLDQTVYRGRVSWNNRFTKDLKLLAGADLEHREANVSLSLTVPANPRDPESSTFTTDIDQPVAVGTFVGVWAQALWTGVPRLALLPGLRVDSYHLVPGIDNLAVEPRLTARYELTDALTLKGGAGVYHMAPTTLINLPAVDLAALRYGLQEGVQTDVGVEWKVLDGVDITADVYWNPLVRTLELSPFDTAQQPQPGDPKQDPADAVDQSIRKQLSSGYAYGFELMIRHPLGGNWFGWLSYSLQNSVRRREVSRHNEFGEIVGTDTVNVPFAYDQTHVLNAVLSYKLPYGWTVGGVVHLNTGRPEIGGLTSVTHVEGMSRGGEPQWNEADLDKADRLPAFLRVDARVSKTWAYDTFTLELYLDVLNASLSKEVLSYRYFVDRTVLKKEPISTQFPLPILGLKASY